ncbi:MAG TPA: sugar ABC transporter permease YjfF, partial [Hyalangium sp.]|nr:sugar ABC transporter permease YjfF [Hyalangium sp.]
MNFVRKHITVMAGVVAYVLLYAIAAARYDGFLSLPVFINFLSNNAVLGIVAVGMTFVILSGGIDLSVGS